MLSNKQPVSGSPSRLFYPLSTGQSGIWFAQALDPASAAYNVGRYVEIFGPVDPVILERAIRQAISDTDSQRIGFVSTEDGPRQYIRNTVDFGFAVLDMSDRHEPRTAALAWMHQDIANPFDPAQGPLFRYALLKIADGCFLWYGVSHHLTMDAFSASLLERHIEALYQAYSNGLTALPEQPPSWLDLLEEEDAYLASPRFARDRAYWLEQLSARPDPVTLSGRAPAWPGPLLECDGAIAPATVRALEQRGARCGASLAATIAAAAALYLGRLTGAQDLMLGMPVTGRTSPRLARIIGLTSNVVPLRLRIDLAAPTDRLLESAGRELRSALRHQRFGMTVLRDALGLAPNAPPVYGTLVNFIPADPHPSFVGLPARRHHLGNWRVEDLLITVHAGGADADLRIVFSANRQHYDAPALAGHHRQFLRLLETMAAAGDEATGCLALTEPAERAQLLGAGHGAGTVAPQTLPALFEAQVARRSDATALIFGATSLSYAELDRRANRVAHHLLRLRIGPESIVGLAMERSPEAVIGLLGILKAGAAYLPLDPTLPGHRRMQILDEARPALVLESLAGIEAAGRPEDERGPVDADRSCPLSTDHPAYVIYTSGSTGRPKGVVVTHAGVAALAAAQKERLGVTEQARILQFASLAFDASFWEILMALGHGAALVLAPAHAPGGLALRDALVDAQITHATLPPAVLATLEPDEALSLTCLVVAGEACPPSLVARWQHGRRLINAYGPTETTVCATISAPLSGSDAPIGTPIGGTRVYVLDAVLEPVAIGVPGELYIAGPGLARGYLNRPSATAERFVADPYGPAGSRMYRTGDVARWRADGMLDFLGRADRQLKLRGYRIEPAEIEAALLAEPSVGQAAVVPQADRAALAAYLVPRAEATIDIAGLRQHLANRLPSQMIPADFILVEALPLTPSGKLDRDALVAAAGLPPQPARSAGTAPLSPTEKTLEALWRTVLLRDQIERLDDFFDLGGHSLSALQLVSQIRDAFGLELPLQAIFEGRSLQAQAALIDCALTERHPARGLPPVQRASDGKAAPLSYSQERMWLIQSLEPGNTAYNIAVGLKLSGLLDTQALSAAFAQLCERHENLRSVVRVTQDGPRQEIGPGPAPALEIVDLCAQDGEAWADALRAAEAAARIPFDLTRGPVIRARLFVMQPKESLLVLILHHIAADHWSMGVLGRELAALYGGLVAGAPHELDPLPIRYRDYALWQRSTPFAAELERQLGYWRRQLVDLPVLELPTDRPRPQVPSSKGAVCRAPIPVALAERLDRLGQQSGGTLFMTMVSAFAALLCRITNQTDIPIGVPVANRTQSAFEGLVGTFVNTLVLRVDVSGDPTSAELLSRVRKIALEAFAHQDVPFERLVRELAQHRETGRLPLTQVLFNVMNTPMHGMHFAAIDWQPVAIDRGGAQFELSISVDSAITRSLYVEYNTDLFDRITAERMAERYLTLLDGVAGALDTRISALPLLPASELALLASWNATSAPFPSDRTCVQLFEEQAALDPARPAASFEGCQITYGELRRQAEAIADRLRAMGVGPGVPVGLCVRRSLALLPALLGVQKSGGAYVPLDPDYPAERLRFMLADSGAKVLVTAGAPVDGLTLPDDVAILDVTTPLDLDPSSAGTGLSSGPLDPVYIIYTSGSTGRPKGVTVSHRALVNFLYSMQRSPGLAASDVLAAVTTISFDIAALELYLPLLVGARIELIARETASDGAALARQLAASGATSLQATPSTWRLLLEAGWSGGQNFRALCGGEPLPPDLANALRRRVGALWNMYGPTETTIWSTIDQIEADETPVSIGRPIANTEIHILDTTGERTPIRVAGEICIGGAGLAVGYHGNPAATGERFIPDRLSGRPGARLYRTGDQGYWGADGKLYQLGRLDDQVKIRGVRIELGEIEGAIRTHPAVTQAVVAVREAQPGDHRLVAYMRYREAEDLTASELRRYLRQQLPEAMIPSMVVPLDRIPLTPNGKLDRRALPDPFGTARPLSAELSRPSTDTEGLMAEIWRSVLKIDQVGVDENFFDLGGHSVLSLRVAHLVEKRTGHRMDPRALFFNTLRQVAALVDRETGGKPDGT